VGEIRPGDHAAFPFTTCEEQEQVIGQFLRDGLDALEKVIYLSDAPGRPLPGLADRHDLGHLAQTGQLRVIPRAQACLNDGRFDPDRMLRVIGEEIALAAGQRYDAVRLSADMSWALSERGGYPLMLACETRFDDTMTPGSPITAVCQLDRRRCRADQVGALTDAHRIRVVPDPEFDDGILRITRTYSPDGLRLAGEVDARRHAAFLAALIAISSTRDSVHVDFAEVRFMDLATLRLLVTHTLDALDGSSLVLDNLPPDVDDLIQTLGWRNFPGLVRGRPMRPSPGGPAGR
jgi:anti-anti-sigma regulatory factor